MYKFDKAAETPHEPPMTLFLSEATAAYWRGENTHHAALNFYPIFNPFFEAKVSGVSVQDMLLCLPYLSRRLKFCISSGFHD